MLKREAAKKGAKLLLNLSNAAREEQEGQRSMLMSVGVAGKTGHREVQLVSGDVLVVEAAPRKEGGRYLCRVRRAISQSVGDVSWDSLRKSAAVLGLNPRLHCPVRLIKT